MLTEEQLDSVREEFLTAMRGISREGADLDGMASYLDAIGFFRAPASTRYNCAFEGGLALHSLNVARELYKIVRTTAEKAPNPEWKEGGDQPKEVVKMAYENDSILIVGLFHDLAKASMYEPCSRNEKVYSGFGKKRDDLGNFDWVSTLSYRVKDANKRDMMGPRGFSAYYILSRFIPLSDEEAFALVNQFTPGDDHQVNMPDVLSQHWLAAYLNAADVVATYCIERD